VKRGGAIAAVLTPLAPGAIAVVGIAGDDLPSLLVDLLRHRGADRPIDWTFDRPIHCRIMEGGEMLDEAVFLSRSPDSGRRIELCTHGGVRIVERLLGLLGRLGVGVVSADEFERATTSVDAIIASVDRTLISAASRRLACWLLAQRSLLPEFLRRWAAIGEAERAAFLARSEVARRLVAGLHVAIVGPPNAGKSTLANRLIGRDRVIVSPEAGTTRDWVSETALVDGWPVRLTDTAGLRETQCEIETEAIARGRREAAGSDLVLLTIDATVPAVEQQRTSEQLSAELGIGPAPIIVVQTKCDLPDAQPRFEENADSVHVSAADGTGIASLERAIVRRLRLDQLVEDLPTAFLPEHRPAR
jgi:tRNA modification GTPase